MKMQCKRFCLAAAAMVMSGALGAQSALATPILMLDFGATDVASPYLTNSPYHTVNGSFTETSWVKRSANGTGNSFYSDGTTAFSGVLDLGMTATNNTTVDLSSNPGGNSALGNQTNTGVYAGTSVGKDAIYNGSASQAYAVGVQVTGLAAGTYDVYIAARGTNNTAAVQYTMYAGTGNVGTNFDYSSYSSGINTFASASTYTTSWVQNENYVKISNITLSAGQGLNIAAASTGANDLRGYLNMVQIVQVPEPGSFALLLFGALGLVRLRRRR